MEYRENLEKDLPKEDTTINETTPSDKIILETAKWTKRRDIPLAILAWAGVVVLAIWATSYIARVLLLLIIAALLAYAIVPLVTMFERIMPRFLAIIMAYLLVISAIGALLYFATRVAIDQFASLTGFINSLLTPSYSGNPGPIEKFLRSFGISQSQITSIRNHIITQVETVIGSIVPLLTGFFNVLLDISLVAILSVYLLIDGTRVTNWLRSSLPRQQQGRVHFLLDTLQQVVGGYIRGQLLLCSLIGLLVGAGMAIIGVPYAFLLGLLAFVLEFIPIFGTIISGAICVLLALTQGWLIAIIALIYFIVVQIIESNIAGPRIVGKAVGLHPVISIIALTVGGELFGLWGILLASPIVGVLQAFLIAIWSEWRETHPKDFQAAKNTVAHKVGEMVNDSPDDPIPPAKLLS